MFEIIKDDICKVKEKLGLEKMLENAPVYLLPQKADTVNAVSYSLQQFMIDLEKSDVFPSKGNSLFHFFVEEGTSELGITTKLGMCDSLGRFKTNLEQWVVDLTLKYYIKGGIVLMSLTKPDDVIQDKIWCEQLFRHMRKYKNRFLFFISFEEKETERVQDWIGKEFLIETVPVKVPTEDDYYNHFACKCEQFGLQLGEDAESKIKSLINKYFSDVNYRTFDLWHEYTMWNFLKKNDESSVLQNEDLSEEILVKITKNNHNKKNTKKIGF